MADIKVTLSTNARLRAPDIQEEARWMAEDGPLYYPLSGKPRRANEGCWLYYIRSGNVVARSRVIRFVDIEHLEYDELYTYTSQPTPKSRCSVECSAMELASSPIPHKGFQGFRYVTPDEQDRFESAFAKAQERNTDKTGGVIR